MNHEDSKTQSNPRLKNNRKNHFVFSSWCLCVFVVIFLPLPGSASGLLVAMEDPLPGALREQIPLNLVRYMLEYDPFPFTVPDDFRRPTCIHG